MKNTKKAFSMIELLYTLVVLSALLSISISMDFVYSQDKATELNQEVETFMTVAKDIEKSINVDGEPVKLSTGYITFREKNTTCLYSYYYNAGAHTFSKIVDPGCTSSNLGSVRSIYKENVRNVNFTDLGNKIFKFEITYSDKLYAMPFVYVMHVPLYTLN